jgi:hypothetical protein
MAQAADVDLDHILWAMPEWIEVRTTTVPADIITQLTVSVHAAEPNYHDTR